MRLHAPLAVFLAAPLLSCASSGATAPARSAPRSVDLRAARAAVEEARKVGAPQRAAETFRQAETHLREAESLASKGAPVAADRAQRAEMLGRLATAEARCATNLTRLSTAAPTAAGSRSAPDARTRRAEEERRRLEEKVALLQRELELTEMEVVRTKARLQGIETKAEASSAIAEARILIGRLIEKGDRTTATRCEELLAKAEAQIAENNFGAAVFFARKAQEIATSREPVGGQAP